MYDTARGGKIYKQEVNVLYMYIYIYILEFDLSLYRDRVGMTKIAKWHRSLVDIVRKSRHQSRLRLLGA